MAKKPCGKCGPDPALPRLTVLQRGEGYYWGGGELVKDINRAVFYPSAEAARSSLQVVRTKHRDLEVKEYTLVPYTEPEVETQNDADNDTAGLPEADPNESQEQL